MRRLSPRRGKHSEILGLMHIDFYGLRLSTPRVTCYLWSPWRASALEHRLFDAIGQLSGVAPEQDVESMRLHITDAKTWKAALTALCRVLKGWQEDATDAGRERRAFRWLLEGDTDDHGYDHAGEPACLWAYLRLGIERGNLEDAERSEDIDLNGFGLRIWPENNA
ncbi:MAG: hypothetical protein L0Y72_01240 [Gemmataceae bacterium]|nr:hypothetical protein [Gemmataceae bacterium]MCI0737637.1 hypothetical protein [Gemmataceae bacterium]